MATFRGNVLLAFFVIKNIVIKYVGSRETYKQKEQEYGGSCSFCALYSDPSNLKGLKLLIS